MGRGRLSISIPFMWIAITVGLVVGILTGGMIGGVKGLLYSLAVALAGSLLALIPMAGPLITWFWLMPRLKEALELGEEMFIVDVIVIVGAAIVNTAVSLLAAAALLYIARAIRSYTRLRRARKGVRGT